jgi:hypothetical protein
MTRRLIPLCFMLATFLKANLDPLAAPDAPSSSNEFFEDADLFTGPALSETNESALPFDLSETFSEEQSEEPAFLFSVIGLPRPAAAEMFLVQSSLSVTQPQEPLDLWLLLGAGLMTVALLGGIRVLRVRRSFAAGRKRYRSSGTSGFVARNALLINESSRPPAYEQHGAPTE